VKDCYLASGCNGLQFGSETIAPFRNIHFENITIRRAGKAGISITAKGNHPVEDAEVEPAENDERFPRHVGTIPAYAWYLRHVKNIRLLNCNFPFEKPDGRPAFVIDNGTNILIDNTVLPIGTKCSSRINIRDKSNNIEIKNCKGMANRKLDSAEHLSL
jgi:hypothetical protein